MMDLRKIVVFTGGLSYAACKGIVEIDQKIPSLNWLIMLHSPKRKIFKRLVPEQLKNIKQNGFGWIPYRAKDVLKRKLISDTGAAIPEDMPGAQYSLDNLELLSNVKIVKVPDIHGQRSLTHVKRFGPDLGLSFAAPDLSPTLFSIPKLGTFNLYKGKFPDALGMPYGFWELWNNEKSVDCSVHVVDEEQESRRVLLQSTINCEEYSTVRGLQLHLDELGIELMTNVVKDTLSSGALKNQKQITNGKLYQQPTLKQAAELDSRILKKHPPRPPLPKRVAKELFFSVGHNSWGLIRKLLPPRVTIVLYHRVSDDVRDNLTVGVEQFNRHMALLRQYCTPVSLTQMLSWDVVPQSTRPLVAVTFDDGYLDNFVHAAPSLERNGIPAAFFVSTGILDTNGRFPHDVLRGNPHIPLMNWDQLRQLQSRGFIIGSHAVTHIDCAAEPEALVREELIQSKLRLQQELNIDSVLFAYPYGKRTNMTPERLEMVKQAGYSGCLSAYGETNIGKVDRFDIKRRGIHWEFSDRAFLYECLGL